MKKLVLLLVVLPLPAFAASATAPAGFPLSKETAAHIARAESYCRANDIGPPDLHYTRCVVGYLEDQYGITIGRAADGSLLVARYRYSQDRGPVMGTGAFGNPPSSNQGTWPQTPAR
jgi:hypothetical protein